MKKVIYLAKQGNIELAVILINSIHWVECIKWMMKQGWDKLKLKELYSKPWFVSWQVSCQHLFCYLISLDGWFIN
jgi:hypothetical protein